MIGVQEELFILPQADPAGILGVGATVLSSSIHPFSNPGSLACSGPLDLKFSCSVTGWALKTKLPLNLGKSALLSFQIYCFLSVQKNLVYIKLGRWVLSCWGMTHFLCADAHRPCQGHGPANQFASPSSLYVDPEPHSTFSDAARSKGWLGDQMKPSLLTTGARWWWYFVHCLCGIACWGQS